MKAPLIGVVGPTASGKTDLALALARRLPVEILVADSRQVYRGMDVGTAKPDAAARAAVPHHLLDLVNPDEPFTVAQWVARARELIAEVGDRGRIPMLVGGTGLYVEALLAGHDYDAQAWSPERRAAILERLETEGLQPLADELRVRAAAVAARTDLRNPRRVVRALERLEGGSEPPTAAPYAGRVAMMGLSRPPAVLAARIDERARLMFERDGLLEEVQRLLDAGYGPELRPMTGHGYREAARHLAGEWSLAQAIEVTARRTRQYAKRQRTWFRREPRIMWLAAGSGAADAPELVSDAERLIRTAIS
ncbi:MAG: tRNA (adenosine(37)-N6)-dimethylallyltransferase MiaA [Chloroflexota bacterium]|nr:tRNA (adenosine(37)-N6)-dimethylallyltransferase MiaA [Chloroflexota bacterium]